MGAAPDRFFVEGVAGVPCLAETVFACKEYRQGVTRATGKRGNGRTKCGMMNAECGMIGGAERREAGAEMWRSWGAEERRRAGEPEKRGMGETEHWGGVTSRGLIGRREFLGGASMAYD